MLEQRQVSQARGFVYAVLLHAALFLVAGVQFSGMKRKEPESVRINVSLAFSDKPVRGDSSVKGGKKAEKKKPAPPKKEAKPAAPAKPAEVAQAPAPKKETPPPPPPKKEAPPAPPPPEPKKPAPVKKEEPKPEPPKKEEPKPAPPKEQPKKPEPPAPPKKEEINLDDLARALQKAEDKEKKELAAKEKAKEKAKKDDAFDSLESMLNENRTTAEEDSDQAGGTVASTSEEAELIKSQIMRNWQVPLALQGKDIAVEVAVRLNRDGTLISVQDASSGRSDAGYQALKDSVYRAVQRSVPITGLPEHSYEGSNGWNTVRIRFVPTDMGA
jgi:hypothetical protein